MDSIIIWSRSIVISVIITIVIEMILPENNSKKYIKIVLGIFIVYSIISPVFEFFSGKNLDQIIDKGEAAIIASSKNIEESKEQTKNINVTIKKIYSDNLKHELESMLEKNGYIADQIEIAIANDDSYNIDEINIKIKDKSDEKKDEKQVQSVVDTVKQIVIKFDSNQNNKKEQIINSNDINIIKNLVKENFGVDFEKIKIC